MRQRNLLRAMTIGFFAPLLISALGCGSQEAVLINDLKATGLAYHNYHDTYKQGPPGWEELIAFAGETNSFPESVQRVRDAGYQMQWNVKFGDLTQGLSNTVMAERPSGGPTLMMDGSVRTD